jgi:cytochrome b pre-mRNA-processing protein 3
MIASALKRLFTADSVRTHAHEAYVHIVNQARHPQFFAQWQVADTVDGRFDVVLLHLSLVIARIERETQDAQAKNFIRTLSEVFFSDMDRSLREMGAGDTGVGKRINKMAQAFYGRLKAYSDALAAGTGFTEAAVRNIYREQPPSADITAQWEGYARRNNALLAQQTIADIMRGQIRFIA